MGVIVGWGSTVAVGVTVCWNSHDKRENTRESPSRTLLAWLMLFLIRLLLAEK
jgi:hypothetical protein